MDLTKILAAMYVCLAEDTTRWGIEVNVVKLWIKHYKTFPSYKWHQGHDYHAKMVIKYFKTYKLCRTELEDIKNARDDTGIESKVRQDRTGPGKDRNGSTK